MRFRRLLLGAAVAAAVLATTPRRVRTGSLSPRKVVSSSSASCVGNYR